MAKVLSIFLVSAASCVGFISENAWASASDYDWSGPYVGVDIGNRRMGEEGVAYTLDTTSSVGGERGTSAGADGWNGLTGNLHAGYNWWIEPRFVFGLETSVSLSDTDHDSIGKSKYGISYKTQSQHWGADLKVRAGYAMGQALLFADGGVAWQHIRTTNTQGPCGDGSSDPVYSVAACSTGPYNSVPYGTKDTSSDSKFGWTAGGGIELGVTRHLSARVQYVHADYGTNSFTYPSFNRGRTMDVRTDDVLAGVNYRF